MSRFRLHTKSKENVYFKYLALGLVCLLAAGSIGYLIHSLGTARAKSQETVLIFTEEEFEQYLLDQESEDYDLGGRYRLEADLDLSWLGDSVGTNVEPFTGAFDGNGHVISGLGRPLFGVVNQGRLENLFFSDAWVTSPATYSDGERYVDGYGALAAYVVDSEIRNCGMSGEISLASPAEAQYLLEKASPADAEEMDGSGMEGPAGETGEKEESSPVMESGEIGAGGTGNGDGTSGPVSGSDAGPGVATDGEESDSETEKSAEVGPGIETATESDHGEHVEPSASESESTEETENKDNVSSESVTETTEAGKEESIDSNTEPPAESDSIESTETNSDSSTETDAEPVTEKGQESATEETKGSAAEKEPAAEKGSATEKEPAAEKGSATQKEAVTQAGARAFQAGTCKEVLSALEETIGFRSNDRQQLLMKIPEVMDLDMNEVETEAPSEATPSDATPSDAQEGPGAGGFNDQNQDESEETTGPEVPGAVENSNGDVIILVTAERITAGGLVAEVAGGTLIADSFSLVTVESDVDTTETYAGGLIGRVRREARLENSYAAGLADTRGVTGGFAAWNDGTIQNCYSSMTIGKRGTVRKAFTAMGEGILDGCVYDRQIACVEGGPEVNIVESAPLDMEDGTVTATGSDADTQAEFSLAGLNTSELTGMEAAVPGNWYLTDHAYPQLEYFSVNEHETLSTSSKASAIALVLPDGMTLEDVVQEDGITLPSEIDGTAISWEAEGGVRIDENNKIVSEGTQMPSTAAEHATVSNHEVPEVGISWNGSAETVGNAEDLAVMGENAVGVTGETEGEASGETTSEAIGEAAEKGTGGTSGKAITNTTDKAAVDSGNESGKSIQLKGSIGEATRSFTLSAVSLPEGKTYANWGEVGADLAAAGASLSGNGTEESPYLIGTREDMALFAHKVTVEQQYTLHAKMTANIDLIGTDISTSGSALLWSPIQNFQGVFDGDNHYVENLNIVNSNGINGFFYTINLAVVKNFGVKSGNLNAGGKRWTGIVIYSGSNSKVLNCWNGASLSNGHSEAGGVVGLLGDNSLVEGCYNTGYIRAGNWTGRASPGSGGVVGTISGSNSVVRNCYNFGTVSVVQNAGGIVGGCNGGANNLVENCFNAGTMSGRGNIGSILGANRNNSITVKNCYYDNRYTYDAYATPLTPAQLQSWGAAFALNGQRATQEGTETGFSWTYNPNANSGYPSLATGNLKAPNWLVIGQGVTDGLIHTEGLTPDATTGVYTIRSGEQLAQAAVLVNNGTTSLNAVLGVDINLTGERYGGTTASPVLWTPMGTAANVYKGSFDGQGRAIGHMMVVQDGYAGLFGCAGGGAVIQGVGLDSNCHVIASGSSTEDGTAALVGAVSSDGTAAAQITIRNCYSRARVEGKSANTAAFVGNYIGTPGVGAQRISNCYNAGLITSAAGTPFVIAGVFTDDASAGAGIRYCYWDKDTSSASGVNLTAVGSSKTVTVDSATVISKTTAQMKSDGGDGILNSLNTGQTDGSWRREAIRNDGYPTYFTGIIATDWADVGSVVPAPSCENYASQETAGQKENPYYIWNAENLAWFAWQVNQGNTSLCGELMADIELFGEVYTGFRYIPGAADVYEKALKWIPIGDGSISYTGTFLGNGHTISVVRLNGAEKLGLFGTLGDSAEVEGIKLNSSRIRPETSGGTVQHAGGIAGNIAGANVTVTNCENVGTLELPEAGMYFGGIIGSMAGSNNTVTQCRNLGMVKAAGNYLGGIVGVINGTGNQITKCENGATLQGQGDYQGGITGGSGGSNAVIDGCFNSSGHMVIISGTSNKYIGGILGGVEAGTITVRNCYNRGTVSGMFTMGGIVGKLASGSLVTGCYNAGTVNGSGFAVKSIAGDNAGTGNITYCYYVDTYPADDNAMDVPAAVMQTWGAAYVLNGEKLSQSTGISWTYQPGDQFPTYGTLSDAASWEVVAEGVGNHLWGSIPTGTPLQIETPEHLAWFARQINQGALPANTAASLKKNISLAGSQYVTTGKLAWIPIGKDGAHAYKGAFQSDPSSAMIRQIQDLYVNITEAAGLFGHVDTGATITRTGLVNASITGETAGGIAGELKGNAEISKCYQRGTGSVTGVSRAGGIAGRMAAGTKIRNCYNMETVIKSTGTSSLAGGIAGDGSVGTIANCYNACLTTGSIATDSGNGGSITGSIGAGMVLNGCYSDKTLLEGTLVGTLDCSTDEKLRQQADLLNTVNGVENMGTDRIWFTSMAEEGTKGLPTLDPPVMMTVTVNPADMAESGGNVTGAAGVWSGGSLPASVLYRGVYQEKSQTQLPVFQLVKKADVTGNFHIYGTDNAHKKLALEGGSTDFGGLASSLTNPTAAVGSPGTLTLYAGAAYTCPDKRTLLLDLATKTGSGADLEITRYEVRVEVQGVTRDTLSVTLPVKTYIELKPGVDTKAYTTDLSIINRDTSPVEFGITGVAAKETTQAGINRKLKPVARSITIDNTKTIDEVKLGIEGKFTDAATGALAWKEFYYTPADGGTAASWLNCDIGYGQKLDYRYFIEHSLLHVGAEQNFGFDIIYQFGIPAGDVGSVVNGSVN